MSRGRSMQVAAARVRATGERVTPARVRVLAALLRGGGAMTHHELEQSLSREAVDRVTLYRVLDWLVAQNLAHRISGADRAWRFSAADRRHDAHAHFHCGRCGKVSCLEEVRTGRTARALPPGFRAVAVETTVRGVCAGCS